MTLTKKESRQKRKIRIKKKLAHAVDRPRLVVFRSLNHLYAQVTDPVLHKTLFAVSTLAKDFSDKQNAGNCKGAASLGKILARKAKEKKIASVVFDRNGFLYHGRVKALAEAARAGGLKF